MPAWESPGVLSICGRNNTDWSNAGLSRTVSPGTSLPPQTTGDLRHSGTVSLLHFPTGKTDGAPWRFHFLGGGGAGTFAGGGALFRELWYFPGKYFEGSS